MIEKPTIVVTSLGRTGTRFFATMLGEVLPGSTSLHEPDVFQIVIHGKQRFNRSLIRIREQVGEAGLSNLLIRKATGRWSLIRLSDVRVKGLLGHEDAVRQTLQQRGRFVRSQPGSVYVESNAGYYGLIDVLGDVYRHHKVAFLIRDGRDWVRSKMNWGEMYGKGELRSIFAHTWPTALEIDGDPYGSRWDTMSRFDRVCWAWTRLNRYALEAIPSNPDAQLFRFEDVFRSERRYDRLTELVEFVTDLPGVEPVPAEALEGWLDKKIHGSSGDFPTWDGWSIEQRETFLAMCGSLMEELGYSLDENEV
jgi:hypothetical protein